MTKKDHSVNVLMDDDDYAKLEALGQHLIISRGEALRVFLRHAYTMIIKQQATCADGQICYSPQMHPRRPTTLVPIDRDPHPAE